MPEFDFPDFSNTIARVAQTRLTNTENETAQNALARTKAAQAELPDAVASGNFGAVIAADPETGAKAQSAYQTGQANRAALLQGQLETVTNGVSTLLGMSDEQAKSVYPALRDQIRNQIEKIQPGASSNFEIPQEYPGKQWLQAASMRTVPALEQLKLRMAQPRLPQGTPQGIAGVTPGNHPMTTLSGSSQWDGPINFYAQKAGVDPVWAKNVGMQEGSLNPNAPDNGKQMGMFQISPTVAKQYGANPRDPLSNVAAGISYLGDLQKQFGSPELATIAYNWGPENTQKWLDAGADPTKLPAETQAYIGKLFPGATGPSLANSPNARFVPLQDGYGKPIPVPENPGMVLGMDQQTGETRPIPVPGGPLDPQAKGAIAGAEAQAKVGPEVEAARAKGLIDVQTEAGKQAVTLGNTAAKAEQEGLGKTAGTLIGEYKDASDKSQTLLPMVNEMLTDVDKMPVGGGAHAKAWLAKYAQPLGLTTVAQDTALSDYQKFEKYALQLVTGQTKELGSREAASIVTMLRSANPNAEMTPQAIKSMLGVVQSAQEWDQARYQAASDWEQGHHGSLLQFDAQWQKKVPLISFIAPKLTLDQLKGPLGKMAAPYLSNEQLQALRGGQ